MTIDEAIVHAREVAESRDDMCEECRQEHEQLAEWLEELKEYKATNTCEWIKYDHRTMCPKNHGDIDNPYWRIPTDMKYLSYCPYCGTRIRLVE